MAIKRYEILFLLLLALLAPTWAPVDLARTTQGKSKQAIEVVTQSPLVLSPSATRIISQVTVQLSPKVSTTELAGVETSIPTPTPTWVWNPPGEVVAPILLYHHIAEKTPASRYFISLPVFEAQMRSLRRWGYTIIPLSLLVRALTEGADLPPKPVVITFDDGFEDVFKNAFPCLKRYGFSAVVYAIAGQTGLGNYMDAAQLRALSDAGWEIGSHSWTHASLRSLNVDLGREIIDSRQALEEMLDGPVETFAFPYGLTSKFVTGEVKDAGYLAAVGLGISYHHTEKTRYYLSRIEVRSDYDLKAFASLLPWKPGDSSK